ncbi:MAG: molybdate ABC transporter substrate-binding protein [Phycisphaeraceae bacterium]|nr:molybdate ABC transporter substrate-binding protein [Phycisphaeraceae bacterium]
MSRFGALVLIVLALLAAGCSKAPSHEDDRVLRVAAASSVRAVAEALAREFESDHPGVRVTVTPGASGTLVAQMRNGAPFDVFLSADMNYPAALAAAGLTLDPPRPYARGELVLWLPATAAASADGLALDVLRSGAVRQIAIANPDHAPYGQAATSALRSLGLYELVATKLAYGENVEQAAQFAHAGAAEAAILPRSLVSMPPLSGSGRWIAIPATAYEPIEHGVVVLKSSPQGPAAREFAGLILSPRGGETLARHGLTPVSATP